MSTLPVEILVQIARYLTEAEILVMASVSHTWRHILQHVTFVTLVDFDTIKCLSYFDRFQNVRNGVYVAKYPKCLRSLVFNRATETLRQRHIPAGLQYLTLGQRFKTAFRLADNPQLEYLDLMSVNTLAQMTPYLPPSLRHLTCRVRRHDMIPILHSNYITHLRLFYVGNDNEVIKIRCDILPRYLTHLTLNHGICIQDMENFPFGTMISWKSPTVLEVTDIQSMSQIQKLVCANDINTNQLAPTIKHLTCIRLVTDNVSKLQNLYSLTLNRVSRLDFNWMPQLQNLSVSYVDSLDNLSHHKCLRTMILDTVTNAPEYPESLRHLRIRDVVHALPETMTRLMITQLTHDVKIPESVTHLYLFVKRSGLKIELSANIQSLAVTSGAVASIGCQQIRNLAHLRKLYLQADNRHPYQNGPFYLQDACRAKNYRKLQSFLQAEYNLNANDTILDKKYAITTKKYPRLASMTPPDITVYLEPDIDIDISGYEGDIFNLKNVGIIHLDFRTMA